MARLWQLEADAKRQPIVLNHRSAQQAPWNYCLVEAVSLLGIDPLMQAWQAINQVLKRSWRGSMLCEYVNSLLHPVLAGTNSSDQGCPELFTFSIMYIASRVENGQATLRLNWLGLVCQPIL